MIDLIEELRRYNIVCEESLVEYVECITKDYEIENGYSERHHILPKSMFPEFKNSKWNIKVLPYKVHAEAHVLLHKMYRNRSMSVAAGFMQAAVDSDAVADVYRDLKLFFSGENNPSKRVEVREKIRVAKTGKPRTDMIGKKYFGASEETIKRVHQRSSEVMSGTVCVKYANQAPDDKNYFRVDVDDPRLLSGELVGFGLGVTRPNNCMKSEDIKNKQLGNRKANYEKYKSFSYEEMVDYLVSVFNNGKRLFSKRGFSGNYSHYVNLSGLNKDQVYNSVVQRLSKSGLNLTELSRVGSSDPKQ